MIKAIVFSGYGINCEREMAFAVERAGGSAEIVHLGTLLEGGKVQFGEAKFLLFPGGFSFGDELGAAKALANRLERLKESLWEFAEKGGLILGVCNGFQLLVKLGLLPALYSSTRQSASLISNDSGKFIARWVLHRALPSTSVFTRGISELLLPIRHGEGKLIVQNPEDLPLLFETGQVPLQYADNLNGSMQSIAALADPSGRILGMMAHPEAATLSTHHPEWTRQKELAKRNRQPFPTFGDGLQIFSNAIRTLEGQ